MKWNIYIYNKSGIPLVIDCTQGSNDYEWEFDVKDYEIPPGAEARIYIRKPSGFEIYNDCIIDGNTIKVDVTTQMTAENGKIPAQFQIIPNLENPDNVKPFVFWINVQKSLLMTSQIESTNEFTVLDNLIAEARNTIDAVQAATQKANQAAEEANEAKDTANTAAEKANKAAGAADTAANQANQAAAGANEAKEEAEAATGAANTAAGKANEAVGAANTAAGKANEAAGAANTAAGKANEAAGAANTAADQASKAAGAANTATEKANTAANQANQAAEEANEAKKAANTATERANTAAERAEKAAESIEGAVAGIINDNKISEVTTYSSQKLDKYFLKSVDAIANEEIDSLEEGE